MSKGYPYDEDEFDAPVDPDGPHGVHRAPRTAWSRWWPFLVVIVLVPALTFAAVYWAMRPQESGDSSSGQTPAVETSPSTEEPPDGDPVDGTEPSDEPSEPAGPVLTTRVMVINAGSGKTGLAGEVSDALKDAGFATQNTPGNGTKGGRTADTVYYQSEDLKATAEAVAEAVSEAQGHPATVEQGLPTVEVPTGETAPQIVVMLVNKPR